MENSFDQNIRKMQKPFPINGKGFTFLSKSKRSIHFPVIIKETITPIGINNKHNIVINNDIKYIIGTKSKYTILFK